MLVLLEGLAMCLWLLLVCVTGIANGPVGLVVLYEKDVRERAVQLGLITREKLRRRFVVVSAALFAPMVVLPPLMVYGLNGAMGFWDGAWQMSWVLWIQGIFDRLFIDWFWVGRTRAWIIPGTEDLRPYIPVKVRIMKWVFTIFGCPLIAAALAGIVSLFL